MTIHIKFMEGLRASPFLIIFRGGVKMRKTTILAMIFFVISVSVCTAQGQSPKAMAETFFRILQGGKISQAYDQLFAGSTIPQTKPQAVETVKRQTESGLPQLGKILGFELIREEKFGTAVIRSDKIGIFIEIRKRQDRICKRKRF